MRIPYAISIFLLTFICSLFPSSTTIAQSSNVLDSLQQALTHSSDTNKVLLHIQIAYQLNVKDLQQALDHTNEALKLSQKLNYEKGIGKANYASGYIYHLKEDHTSAEKMYNLAVSIFEKLDLHSDLSETYSRLGHLYTLKSDYQRSLDIYAKALEMSKKLKDDRNASVIIFSMANSYAYLGKTDKAFDLLKECKSMIKHRPHLINYYAILGDLHRGTGASEQSLEAFFQAVEICVEFNDTLRMAYVFQAIAQTYSELGDYENGANYYFKTIELNQRIASPTLTLVSYLGLGNLYQQWKDYPESLQFYDKALHLAKSNEVNEKIPICHLGKGQIYFAQEMFDQALPHFEEALATAKEWKQLETIIDARIHLGKTHVELKQYATALTILTHTLSIIPKEWKEDCKHAALYSALGNAFLKQQNYTIGIKHLTNGLAFAEQCSNREELEGYYKQLASAYRHINNYPLAFAFQEKYSVVHDSLLKVENSKQLLAMRIQFETAEKEKEITLLQKEQKLQSLTLLNQEAELSRKEAYLLGLGVLLSIGALLFYLFFNRYKLQKRTEQLELENRQIALEQEHLKTSQQLEMAKLRSHFFTDVSHEIRTPLTLILTPVEELLATTNGSPLRKSYELIHRNANRLMELVNQTLDFSKLENGHLPLQKDHFHLGDLIQQVSQKFLPLLESKNIKLTHLNHAPDQQVYCDIDKIEKAISNILSNAIEHSPIGGQIEIKTDNKKQNIYNSTNHKKSEQATDAIFVQIQDQGKGIASEHMNYIFDRFYQVDQNSRKGSGIGLALTKQILELHEGSIEVESRENQGSAFIMSIPLSTHEVHQRKEKVNGYHSSNPSKPNQNGSISHSTKTYSTPISEQKNETNLIGVEVLIVEDNRDLSEYISNHFSERGYKVSCAFNGKEALEIVDKMHPELIVSDVMMPQLDGFDFAKKIKNELKTCHIPIILLTAKASQSAKIQGLEIGADDYLTKPFQIQELMVRSKNLIQQRRTLSEVFRADPFAGPKKMVVNVMDEQFLNRALQLVEERIEDANFNVEQFCREIGMSHTNLYNKLKAMTGQNISNFIRTIRLRKAAKLIESNSGNVFEIALQVGFNSRQAFNKAFKDHFGVSPSTFRKKQHAARIEPNQK